MKTLDHNAISRALSKVGYQYALDMHHARHSADAYRLAEVLQQYQLDISGTSGSGAHCDFTVNFHEVMYYAPTQRNIKTEDPHFTYGYQLDTGDVKVYAYVTQWLLDESANYLGAIVRVVVEQLAFAQASPFAGSVHVTFQGFGIPVEDPGYTDTP